MNEWFWILALAWPHGSCASSSGTIFLRPGATRGETYLWARNHMLERDDRIPKDAVTTFFYLEPHVIEVREPENGGDE